VCKECALLNACPTMNLTRQPLAISAVLLFRVQI
jgi:hypothetical protein